MALVRGGVSEDRVELRTDMREALTASESRVALRTDVREALTAQWLA